MGRDGVARGNLEFELIGNGVSQEEAGEIGDVGAIVIEFEPVIVFSINRIGDGICVGGHPFVDGDRKRSTCAVVRAAWRRVEKVLTREALGIRE